MPRTASALIALLLTLCCWSPALAATELTPAQQAKIETMVKEFQGWGADPKMVEAVKSYNTAPSADAKGMTNEKWTSLTVLDPVVRGLTKNDLATFLKGKTTETVGEFFVSGADGGKVALSSKTTSWNHKGKPKHDLPMTGKTWQGKPELDESTGKVEVQVAVPIVDGTTPIGSLVVGIVVNKL